MCVCDSDSLMECREDVILHSKVDELIKWISIDVSMEKKIYMVLRSIFNEKRFLICGLGSNA